MKANIFRISLMALCLLFSTKVSSYCNNTIMKHEEVSFEIFLQNVAILYGVHSQLIQDGNFHIPELDSIVSKAKIFLAAKDISFNELADNPDFVRVSGQACMCSYALYPQLEAIFKVTLPKPKKLDLDRYCKDISIERALRIVSAYIL